MSRLSYLAAGASALALALAGCGGSSSGTSSAGTAGAASASTSSSAGTTAAAGASTSSSAASSARSAAAAGGLSVAADPTGLLAFKPKTLTAKAGTVKIDFTNQAPEAHNMTIQQGTSGPVVGSTPTFDKGTKTITVKLKPGTYTFFCSVPGHRMGGMQGTLTVT
jgi:plastocyanin